MIKRACQQNAGLFSVNNLWIIFAHHKKAKIPPQMVLGSPEDRVWSRIIPGRDDADTRLDLNYIFYPHNNSRCSSPQM